ncbi:WecB/TagA/CpsF family glycosyltransferase [Actinomadura kijaniata]|uniref:WecB/TagA/CpsF family glycosyltransferase n=1 Tax=Actinomadura kijaniata TaxID=46161 RepID=UPI0008361667|nr:WecB/TagA/CpsF family glycosyltransferase [Actinomadura kijaniata]
MGTQWQHDTVDVLGLRVSRMDVPTLRGLLGTAMAERRRLTVTFANPDYALRAAKDPALRDLINRFDLVLADGWGVVAATRIFGRPVPTRMANDDLTDEFFGTPHRVFLFGNAPGVAEEAAANLRRWFPDVTVAGVQHGHWADASGTIPPGTARRIVNEINEAKPDVLHVGLGTPLQQWFVAEYGDRLDVPVIVTCGAYFEHLAERRQYYPPWVLRLRIGFLYRLAREPRRLWRRYTIELGEYVLRVLAQRLRRKARNP